MSDTSKSRSGSETTKGALAERRTFIVLCSEVYEDKLKLVLADIFLTFAPTPDDNFIIVHVSTAPQHRRYVKTQREAVIPRPEVVPTLASVKWHATHIKYSTALHFLCALTDTTGEERGRVQERTHPSTSIMDHVVQHLMNFGFKVRVERVNLISHTFPSLLAYLYQLLKSALSHSERVIFNISCCDRVTAVAVFTLLTLADKKWRGRVELMHMRTEGNDFLAFKPIVPQIPSKLKDTCRKILAIVSERGKMSLKELTERVGLSKATVSRAVMELEACGLLRSYFEGKAKYVEPGPLFSLAELLL